MLLGHRVVNFEASTPSPLLQEFVVVRHDSLGTPLVHLTIKPSTRPRNEIFGAPFVCLTYRRIHLLLPKIIARGYSTWYGRPRS